MMPQTESHLDEVQARRAQAGVSLLAAGVLGLTFGVLALASHSARIDAALTRWEVHRFETGLERAMDRGTFLEFEDRVLLDDVPHTDYSRGGVYLFGSSPMKWALMSWALTEPERRLIHNYGIGASNHQLQAEFVHFLAEKKGMLDAGEKAHVILGAYWSMGIPWSASNYLGPLVERYGVYRYDDQEGICIVSGGRWASALRLEKARCTSFLKGLTNRLARWVTISLGMSLGPTEHVRDPALVRKWSLADRPNWEKPLEVQMDALRQLVRYIRGRRAEVTLVLLPTRAPVLECPLPTAYRQAVKQLAGEEHVAVADLSELLTEDEYWDLNHSDHKGMQKTHQALMDIAREHLARVGLLP